MAVYFIGARQEVATEHPINFQNKKKTLCEVSGFTAQHRQKWTMNNFLNRQIKKDLLNHHGSTTNKEKWWNKPNQSNSTTSGGHDDQLLQRSQSDIKSHGGQNITNEDFMCSPTLLDIDISRYPLVEIYFWPMKSFVCLISAFAAVIITPATRGRSQARNVDTGHRKLLQLST